MSIEKRERPLKRITFNKLLFDLRHLSLPPTFYEQFRINLNAGIIAFNTAQDQETKKEALIKMQLAIDYIDLHVNPDDLATAEPFHVLKRDLFNQMKKAFAENGVNTLLKQGSPDTPVSRLLADMAPDKADKLMEILHQGNRKMDVNQKNQLQVNLKYLYDSKDKSSEAKQWRTFLKTHTIEFLGGSNSRNYKVTTIDPSDPNYGNIKILKVDNRLGTPRHVEHHLRTCLDNVFTPIDAARQVRGLNDKNEIVSRTLLVTDLCTSGSVEELSAKTRAIGQEATYSGCSDIMSQMAQVYLDIQKANSCFPDSKLTNWLVDANGKIRLADSKSFVFTDNGEYSRHVSGNENVSIISTKGFRPTEIKDQFIDAEKLHSSLLGRNIYAYLTGSWPFNINLNHTIFTTAIGQEYKTLIELLIQDPAVNRMGLREANQKLQELSIYSDHKPLVNKLNEFSSDIKIVITPFIVNGVKSEPDAILLASLTNLKNAAARSDRQIQELSAIYQSGLQPFPSNMLEIAKTQAMHGASSIAELENKITLFAQHLQIASEKLNTYQELFEELKSFGGLYFYLDERLTALMAGNNFAERLHNMETQIEIMQKYKISRSFNYKINGLIEQLSAIIPKETLLAQKEQLTLNATTPDDLENKLTFFQKSLEINLDHMQDYQNIHKELAKLKVGKNDPEMDIFLAKCNQEIDANINEQSLTNQIMKMHKIYEGLNSPENKDIQSIIAKFDRKNSFFTIGMDKKARQIETALANVPIEERAQFLTSDHPQVTALLNALASQRINIVKKPVSEGKIKEADSAGVFKAFRNKFDAQMEERKDVILEESKEKSSKL